MVSMPDMEMVSLSGPATEAASEEPGLGRSSSEEKDLLTPQQSRRKAQNRAA
jgi:hypothetical protein